jgi:hypothetical protein
MAGVTQQDQGWTATYQSGGVETPFAAMLLCAAFLTMGVGLSQGAGAVFALAGRCEMPSCLWGSERLRTVVDELRHWHPESGPLVKMRDP